MKQSIVIVAMLLAGCATSTKTMQAYSWANPTCANQPVIPSEIESVPARKAWGFCGGDQI